VQYSIKITPHLTSSEEDNHVGVVLHIAYPLTYPYQSPSASVEKEYGISDKHLAELQQLVEVKAAEADGEVIVFGLCEFVRDFLHSHNVRPLSFHEEMMMREKEERKKREEEKVEKERKGKQSEGAADSEDSLKARAESTVREAAMGMIRSAKKAAQMRPRKASSDTLVEGRPDMGVGIKKSPSHPDFIRTPLPSQLESRVAQSEPVEGGEEKAPIGLVHTTSSTLGGEYPSRFHTDFEEVYMLGRGAFGEVWKVRNRLDGRFYAVKKIKLHSSDHEFNARVFREVITLSRLVNPNIVRYYQAWVEGVQEVEMESDSDAEREEKNDADISIRSDSVFLASATHTYGSSLQEHLDSFGDSGGDNTREDLSLLLRLHSSYGGGGGGKYGMQGDENHQRGQIRYPEYLFIQMEFCGQTLRDYINDNLVGIDADVRVKEADKLFRQIVDGVQEIHNQGVAHRDLKPANIFVDASGQVKIGDFGLSRATRKRKAHANEGRADRSRGSVLGRQESGVSNDSEYSLGEDTFEGIAGESTLTQGVGTLLYISPEQFRAQRYDGGEGEDLDPMKSDVYALGIVLFEMLYPQRERAERVQSIRNIRKGVFPRDFTERYARHTRYIRALLVDDPVQRPTMKEFAELLPPSSEDSHIQDALRVIADPNSAFLSKLLTVLINSGSSKLAWANSSLFLEQHEYGEGGRNGEEDAFAVKNRQREVVMGMIETVFECHGASHLRMAIFEPVTWGFSERVHAMRTIDEHGKVVFFRHDLREPFVRYLVKNRLYSMRRFESGRVYRCGEGPGDAPKAYWQSDFDIVGGGGRLPDAEVLVVASECTRKCLTELRRITHEKSIRPYVIRVNHTALLDCALDCCQVETSAKPEAIRMISSLVSGRSWPQTRKKMVAKGIIQERMLLWLEQNFLLPKELSPFQTLDRLKTSFSSATFGGSSRTLALQAVADLRRSIEYSQAMDSRMAAENIRVDLSLVVDPSSYQGLVLQVLVGADRESGEGSGGSPSLRAGSFTSQLPTHSLACIIVGGRYDRHLKEAYKKFSSLFTSEQHLRDAWEGAEPPTAIGLSVAIDKLLMLVPQTAAQNAPKASPGDDEMHQVALVWVQSVGVEAQTERLGLVGSLWQAGVPTEVSEEVEEMGQDEVEAFALAKRLKWIIQIREKTTRLSGRSRLIWRILEWKHDAGRYKMKEEKSTRAETCEYMVGLRLNANTKRTKA